VNAQERINSQLTDEWQTAAQIGEPVNMTRVHAYNVLRHLEEKGLCEKRQTCNKHHHGRITIYRKAVSKQDMSDLFHRIQARWL